MPSGTPEIELAGQPALIVEDSELNATRLMRFLKLNGVGQVVHCQGEDAVAQASSVQPGVILLDINLPGASGRCWQR
ncbi:MAG: response regulator [Anaerolineales bacterium]|nr:response regulator [Anaerolineales bacterium]